MKILPLATTLASTAFLLAQAGSAAFADQAAPTPSSADRAAFRAIHERFAQIHTQERSQLLAALTPEHRALFATIVGRLAIAPSPNPRAAVGQLDAALTPNERDAILQADASARTQERALHKQLREQWVATHPETAHAMANPSPGGEAMARPMEGLQPHHPDAGRVLLHAMLVPLFSPQRRMHDLHRGHGAPPPPTS